MSLRESSVDRHLGPHLLLRFGTYWGFLRVGVSWKKFSVDRHLGLSFLAAFSVCGRTERV